MLTKWLRNNPGFMTKGFLYWDSAQGPSCTQEKHYDRCGAGTEKDTFTMTDAVRCWFSASTEKDTITMTGAVLCWLGAGSEKRPPESRFMLERKGRWPVIIKRCRVEANQRKLLPESLRNRENYSSKSVSYQVNYESQQLT